MRFVLLAVALECVLAPSARCAAPVDYTRDIKPVVATHCYACHGALQQKSGLRVDTVKYLLAGGANGPVVIPGRSGDSRLIDHVTASRGRRRMPPPSDGETLSEPQVALLRAWIDQGALGPADEKPEPDPKQHWAFRTPTRPAVPAVKDASRVRNPIDAFLAAERARHGLAPQPEAPRRLLLRRLCLDLIGLPPSLSEQEAFLADPSPDAYEKVVDHLLASDQYGERWGRHWMDIWRYSDWWGLGAEVRNSQKHIWHWRDWIIESLNADKGYDQMLREMLAADELYPEDLDCLRATGYLARPYFIFNRNTWLDEVVEHTSKAFLGLTINCSKCHDHKYDPIRQTDYYRLRAFFEPYQVRLEQVPGQIDFEKDGIPRVFDCNLDAPTYRFVRGDEKRPMKDRPLAPGLPPLLSPGPLDIRPVSLPLQAHAPGLRPFVLEDHLREAAKQIRIAQEELARAQQTLAEGQKRADRMALVLSLIAPLLDNAFARPRWEAWVAGAGRWKEAAEKVLRQPRAALALAEKTLAFAEAQAPALQARAAAERAHWQQPPPANVKELSRTAARAERQVEAARAAQGLARAELELVQAAAPARDAAEAKRNSARDAFAQARKALDNPGEQFTPLRGALKTPESNLETDAARNKRFPSTSSGRRSALAKWLTDPRHPLTARVAVNHVWLRHFGTPLVPTVFDFGRKGTPPTHPALLDYLAVELVESGWSLKNLHRLIVTSNAYRMTSSSVGSQGSVVDPENRWYWRRNPVRMEAEVIRDSLLCLAGVLDQAVGGPPINPVAQEGSRRRSLYFVHSHNDHHKFLSMFDDAGVLECYRRSESIVPQQALALSNSHLALDMAAKINPRLFERLGAVSDAAFARTAFELILCSSPSTAEQAECQKTLREWVSLLQKQGVPDPVRRARADLISALLNHNDFITIR
jgi:hypothetical protein